MKIFKRSLSAEDDNFEAIMNNAAGGVIISEDMALNIPTVAACVYPICSIIGSTPIRLYEKKDGKVSEIKQDRRLSLLNYDTGDLVTPAQMKSRMAYDYLMNGNGYTYINRNIYGEIISLHYVPEQYVSVNYNADPIFKQAKIMCGGKDYLPFDFLKIARNTKRGLTGSGIIDENQRILSVAYHSLKYEDGLVRTGGNKRGFLKMTRTLSKEALERLKQALSNLYSNNEKNIVVLNDGAEFKEASNTVVEMQLNQNKITNANEICKIFNVPSSFLTGKANNDDLERFMLCAVNPILRAIETTLNIDLLSEEEKKCRYFEADTKELLKGDIVKLFTAYGIALDKNIMNYDEVRERLNLKPLGFTYMKLGLQDVIFDPQTKVFYSPNTKESYKMGEAPKPSAEGGEKIED